MIIILKVKRILIVIIAVILVFVTASMMVTKVIYDSIFTRYNCVSVPDGFDALLDARIEKRFLSGKNMLCGYLYKSEKNDKNALIVIAPGFNACADDYLYQISELLDCGWSVFAFNVTGSCTSQGKSSVGFPQEALDVEAALKYLNQNENFGYNDLVLMGHSRGGYAVCCALGYGYKISAVISVSGIDSAMDGVISAAKKYVGAFAYGNYGFLWCYQVALFGKKTVSLSAKEEIEKSDTPVLLIHGAEDKEVPLDEFSIISQVDKTAQNVTCCVREFPDNSGHTNLLFDIDGTANDEIIKMIDDFLQKNLK